MAGQMPGMAVAVVAAAAIVMFMRGSIIAIATVMMAGTWFFTGG